MDSGVVGWLALWGAIAAAGTAGLAGLLARRRPRSHRPDAQGAGVAAGLVASGLAGVAVAALSWSLLTGNFALTYVADTTSRQGSWPYRLAGLWGGNGGSLLLWASLVLGAGVLATRHRPAARLAVVMTGGVLLLVDAVAANPFARLAIPAIDGGGLTPILQYPAMLYHPLLLYGGQAALAGPFALALAGLASGRLDQAWLALTRRSVLVAWLLLGVALVAGAHWAYVELGWGGFWAWDPVENSGLLPWLAATAFLHRARASGATGGGSGRVGLAGLAALPFVLSLVGTTVSRSGAAQSVHGFAQAAAVGRGLLALVVVVLGILAALMTRAARRSAPAPAAGRPEETVPAPAPAGPSAPGTALAAAAVVLLAIALVVLVGTVFPVLAHAFAGQTVGVTARYYAIVVTPIAVVGVALMGWGPSLGHRARPPRWPAAAAVAVVVGGFLARSGHLAPTALGAAAALAAALAAAELIRARSLRRAGALVAHVGMAVLLVGVAGSLLGQHSAQVIRPGGQIAVAGFTLRYRDLLTDEGPGWRRARLIVAVADHGRPVAVLAPALRVFDGQAAALSDVALRSVPGRDLVVTVREIDPATRAATLDVTVRPLVTLVWWGGLLATAGGGLVLLAALSGPPRRRGDQLAGESPARDDLVAAMGAGR